MTKKPTVAQRFNKAALSYDEAAKAQAEVAQHLIDWAQPEETPTSILDIGSGTGLVASAVAARWPQAEMTALDTSPNMLFEASRKIPQLNIVAGDALHIDFDRRFDAIFCSMVLHWLPDPRKALNRWTEWLKPNGRLYVALLTEGSFNEWREICEAEGLKDGLWLMPKPYFAEGMAIRTERQSIPTTYDTAVDFLRGLKATGASAPRVGYEPFGPPVLRRLLGRAAQPFTASYEVLYIELPSSPKS